MSASLVAHAPGVRDLQFTSGTWERLCELGLLLPAGVFVAGDLTYHLAGNPYDGSLVVDAAQAAAVGMCAVALRDALAGGVARARSWVTDQDREIVRWRVLEHIEAFCRECEGFDVR